MITDQQFITALREVVAAAPAGYQFPDGPQYRTPTGVAAYQTPGGEAACLIGAAFLRIEQQTGKTNICPKNDVAISVGALITPWGLSEKVGRAAAIAQIHQDNRGTWVDALWMFEWFLTAEINNEDYYRLGGMYGVAKAALAEHKGYPEVALLQRRSIFGDSTYFDSDSVMDHYKDLAKQAEESMQAVADAVEKVATMFKIPSASIEFPISGIPSVLTVGGLIPAMSVGGYVTGPPITIKQKDHALVA